MLFRSWGVSNVASVLAQINDRIASRLEALGFALPPSSQRCPHIVGARVPQGFPGDLVGSLRAQNVFVSQRGSSIRVAPHLHVTETDVQQLFDALDAISSSGWAGDRSAMRFTGTETGAGDLQPPVRL